MSDWVVRHRRMDAAVVGGRLGYLLAWWQRGVEALVLHTDDGYLYVLGYGALGPRRVSVVEHIRRERRFSCAAVMGSREDGLALRGDLGIPTVSTGVATTRYRLYRYCNDALPLSFAPSEVTVRRATTRDRSSLLQLHACYLHEEVYGPGVTLGSAVVAREVERTLSIRTTMVALYRGRVVAKASTNGSGFLYDQIGGVYTVPRFRNRQIGSKVVVALMSALVKRGRKICLFARESNRIANRFYRTLGFTAHEEIITIDWSRLSEAEKTRTAIYR